MSDTAPKLVIALTYDEGFDFIKKNWPGGNPRSIGIVTTGGGTNPALLCGRWFVEGDVAWMPRAIEGRFYPEIKAAIESRVARV